MSATNEGTTPTAESTGNSAVTANVTSVNGGNNADNVTGNGHEYNRRRGYNANKKPSATTNVFRGETGKMNGHVFQVHSERVKRGEVKEDVEAKVTQ